MHIGGLYAPANKALDNNILLIISDILLLTVTEEESKKWFMAKDTLLVARGFNSIYQNPLQLDIVCPLFANGNKQFTEQEQISIDQSLLLVGSSKLLTEGYENGRLWAK